MNNLKLECQGIWLANLADEYAFKIEPFGDSEIPTKHRFALASRIAKCVNAMTGIGDDNALFAPGNTVRSVISSMELKRLELERQRDELLAALELLAHPSMSGSRNGGETYIGWQSGDGLTADERLEKARSAIAKAKA